MLEWLAGSILLSLFNGSIYVVVSLGLTLTLAVVKLPNFAHAEFLTIGGYVGVIVSSAYPDNLLVIGAAAFLFCAAIALAVHRVAFKPLMDRKVSIYILVLASFAVAQFIRYGVFSWASVAGVLSATQNIKVYSLATLYNTELTNVYALAIVLAILISVLLELFLKLTTMGKSMRAIASNFDLARISGINVPRVVDVMWIIAGGLGGLGGMVFGIYTTVTPVLGFNTLLDIFAVVIIAGLTSFTGTIIGGYIVGFSQNTLMDFLHYYFDVSFGYQPLLPFALIIIILLLKPTGLAPSSQTGLSLIRRFARRSSSNPKEPEPPKE
ncbi:MAG: branched-chain amino acid ABC transporter permease [Thaumarchaeota archaeon]|nr:branched-chain amino acid ABC transporter permease [Nitrososphaerota archaeon]